MGYTNVRDYAGGKSDWMEAGLPIHGGKQDVRDRQNTTTNPESDAA